jgi:probable rRNA maturation factor
MHSEKPRIRFHSTIGTIPLRQRNKLKEFITFIFSAEGSILEELHYIFCSDAYLLQINQKFLNHDTYTDIITFNLSEPNKPIISDIYISIDRIRENAELLQTTFKLELHRVIFHGALHLCGYKDKSKSDNKLMRQKEDYYLARYFVPRETI